MLSNFLWDSKRTLKYGIKISCSFVLICIAKNRRSGKDYKKCGFKRERACGILHKNLSKERRLKKSYWGERNLKATFVHTLPRSYSPSTRGHRTVKTGRFLKMKLKRRSRYTTELHSLASTLTTKCHQ